jgi:hypothetical protein
MVESEVWQRGKDTAGELSRGLDRISRCGERLYEGIRACGWAQGTSDAVDEEVGFVEELQVLYQRSQHILLHRVRAVGRRYLDKVSGVMNPVRTYRKRGQTC